MLDIQALLSGAGIVDAILVLVVLEWVALAVYWKFTRRGVPPWKLCFNLLAGASLLLALRAALSDATTITILMFLSAALVCHLLDLRTRWLSE